MTKHDAHLCWCGHEQMLHFSTNNLCMIQGCPCDEGFQDRWSEMSPRLKAALDKRDAETRTTLATLAKE